VPEWAISLLSVGVGVLLTGLVTALTLRWQIGEERKRRVEDASRDRRERGAAVLGPVIVLLREVDPGHFLSTEISHLGKVFMAALQRWKTLDEQLAVYGAGHPSLAVVEALGGLSNAVTEALYTTDWALTMLESGELSDGDEEKIQRRAAESFDVAGVAPNKAVRLVREEAD
jgi:hypothetical protein